MKKIAILLVVWVMGMGLKAQSQTGGTITGTVTHEEKGVEAITVALLQAKDSAVVKIELSNHRGNFEFLNIKAGKYLLSFSGVGYQEKHTAVFDLNEGEARHMGTMALTVAGKELKAVTVTAKRPVIEQKIDKLVVNVDASPTNAGATAMEVLEKSPGIIVNNDGGISLKGKPGVIVMMDGKPTYLSAADLANLLKNTPASAIEQIEIMTNPSSKYDASGNSGIINIKTKKSLKMGWNGSITVGASAGFFPQNSNVYVMPRSQNSINFNYRKNKINFFGNYNPNFNKGRNQLHLVRKFYNEDGSLNSYADQYTTFKGRNNNHNVKLGLDYYISSKDVVGVVVTGFGFFGRPEPLTVSDIYNADGSYQSGLYSTAGNTLKFRNYTANINYKHSFDSTGKELSVDLDYVQYDNVSDMLLNTDTKDKSGSVGNTPVQLKGHLPSNIHIYSFKSDYVHPFKNNMKMETGIKTNYIKNDNLVDYTRLGNEGWVKDARSNHFIYEENINAAYFNINKKFSDKWSAQAGLRVENTNTKGKQLTNDSSFTRHYTNLFPTAFVSYAADKNNQLTVSYSRRLNRPNYEDLNPFTYFLDSLTYRKGNPYLLPQFSHNIELGHTFKSKFITSINYSKTTDVISELLRQNTLEKTTFATRENIAGFRNIGLSVNAPFKWTPWWSTNVFANVFNNRYKGEYNQQPIDLSNTAFMMNVSNTFTISEGFTAELSGFYRSKVVDQMLLMNEMYQMNIGFQKNILKGKSTVRLNFRDPFGWQRFSARSRYADVDVSIQNRWDTRQVSASFTYRFGKSTIAPSRKRSTGVSDELNRAGQSN
ncbi:MAG: TonB-dependent receptor [Chitinophagaceae bacterium]|nr:TonB-dependent receptor [Chitinophagaceae bacterium]